MKLTVDEIYDVLDKRGLHGVFGDDVKLENAWLVGALRHTLAMLDIARTYVRECQKEWAEMEDQ